MSIQELETAVTNLPPKELAAFHKWFEAFIADKWDQQLAEDVRAGRLDHLARQADEDFEQGRCKPL